MLFPAEAGGGAAIDRVAELAAFNQRAADSKRPPSVPSWLFPV